MIIKKISQNEWQIKTKNSIIKLDGGIQVGEYKIPGSGEYEIAGVEVEVIDGITDIVSEDLNITFISSNKKEFQEEELKKLSQVDILFLPVAGKNTMNIKDALSVINKIEPSIIIPIHYDNLSEFSKSEGIITEQVSQFKISKNNLPEEDQRKVIIFD